MSTSALLIETIVDSRFIVESLVDSGCLVYSAFDKAAVRRLKLPRIPIKRRELRLASGEAPRQGITEITSVEIDIDGRKQRIWGYVVPNLSAPLFLGLPWMIDNDVVLLAKERAIRFGSDSGEGLVRQKGWYEEHAPDSVRERVQYIREATMVMGNAFAAEVRRHRKNPLTQIFSVTVQDISKALEVKKKLSEEEIREQLPTELEELASLFLDDEGDSLPPHRPGIDLSITLEKDEQGRDKELPWGPLYGMSRDELLVLRKTLTELLDKNWIRASSSPGGAPVLFVKKPGGGLRFCVDYRALNKITQKDRYPLPLVRETLRAISKAKWITKVDVRAAFHRNRVKTGDEWKTAFRTRFGAFEWLVMPFGLTGAPAAFQRYINSSLGEYLDWFCSAYLDDVLIYSDGDLADHMEKVRLVLQRLETAGLKLDLKKCEFAVKSVKYLGFIIEVGEGVKVDPEKVSAIKAWEEPTNVKGVRSFVGFANFYRDFIERFSDITSPLVSLTKKGIPFRWGPEQQRSFDTLKERFISAPVLALWDDERETVVEADSSGWAIGATLSQVDDKKRLRPVAFLSKKHAPAECNYEIHDKELLSIVRSLEEWRGELMGVAKPFTILSDHRNLQYFMTTRKLSERQVRWSHFLSQFNFTLKFRAGKSSEKPDALSRREQDIPKGEDDERLRTRVVQLIKDEWLSPETAYTEDALLVQNIWLEAAKDYGHEAMVSATRVEHGGEEDSDAILFETSEERGADSQVPIGDALFVEERLQELWDKGVDKDPLFKLAYKSVAKGDRSFPPAISSSMKVSIGDCEFDERGALLFRKRLWVPSYEPLQTALIQQTHDSHITGHPGRESTIAILARQFFWPLLHKMVRQFCRNCDVCGRSHVWRERKRGLLYPLPIPERFFSELSIDFMTDLPARKKGDPRYLMVVTDRLSKSVTLESMETMDAEACAQRFLYCHFRFHHWPTALTSDRGSNWVGQFWTHLCHLIGIKRRLSTAYHPQTDGSTERMNQEVLAYLRAFVSFAQFDWPDLLPGAQLAINNRNTVLGVSPFFLTHGYHAEPIQEVVPKKRASKPEKRAEEFLTRLKEGQDLAQAAMAAAQQRMEESANRTRRAADLLRVGDKVWLNLRNIQTPQLSKKLSWINSKYKVKRVFPHGVVELDVPTGIYPKFHSDLLKRAAEDPLPSQEKDDIQPPPFEIVKEGGEEYEKYNVESILRAENKRRGRGYRREVLVKWEGYAETNWEPRAWLENTEALEEFVKRYGPGDGVGDITAEARIGRRKTTKKELRKEQLAESKTGGVLGKRDRLETTGRPKRSLKRGRGG